MSAMELFVKTAAIDRVHELIKRQSISFIAKMQFLMPITNSVRQIATRVTVPVAGVDQQLSDNPQKCRDAQAEMRQIMVRGHKLFPSISDNLASQSLMNTTVSQPFLNQD